MTVHRRGKRLLLERIPIEDLERRVRGLSSFTVEPREEGRGDDDGDECWLARW